MSLRNIVKNAVNTVDKITKSLQAEVTHTPWIAQSGDGTPVYGHTRKYKAIVDLREIERDTGQGKYVLTNAYLLFLQPIPPNGAAQRTEPIDPRDKIVCPDGTTGKVAASAGFVDSATTHPYYGEVWLTKYLVELRNGG